MKKVSMIECLGEPIFSRKKRKLSLTLWQEKVASMFEYLAWAYKLETAE